MSAQREPIEVPYGKYAKNAFSAPQRFSKITNEIDRQNATVVFGVLLFHYYKMPKLKLMEVDEFVEDDLAPYWRLCVYGLTDAPTPEQLRILSADMAPVKPNAIVFEKERQSHTVVDGFFLKGALTVHMLSVAPMHVAAIRRPTPLEFLASDHVNEYPTIVAPKEKHAVRASSLLRRKSVPAKRSGEDKLAKVRQRFKNRSFLAIAYDTLLGVSLEAVEKTIASEEHDSPLDDDYDQ